MERSRTEPDQVQLQVGQVPEVEKAAGEPAPKNDPAGGAAEPRSPLRFAMAGQVMGRRRTVFAAIPTAVIRANPLQPRQHFDEEALDELAESIRARGLLQPIIVRREEDGSYTLVAGERRLRASERAGLTLIPAILSNDDLLEVALEENVQREDLTPIEEAEALAALAEERGHSHADLAKVIHKSRPYVSNTLALNRLPTDVKTAYFEDGAQVPREIMISIARQDDETAMRQLWKRVKLESMSVRRFRVQEEGRKPARPVGEDLLRVARRFNRMLKGLDPADLEGDVLDRVARALRKAERRASALLETIEPMASEAVGDEQEPPALEPAPLPVRRAATA